MNCMKNSDIEVDMTYTQVFEKIKMLLNEKCMDKMFFGNGTYCAIGLVEKACMMADERNKDGCKRVFDTDKEDLDADQREI